MNVFKIAWRSIQHRGLGSILTIVSMALGVMMVVAVLTIHGVVSESFRANNSFGYNIIVGARGGGLQLTLNSVYYLSKPVENIPYEYYLAFCDAETRQNELKHSIAYTAQQNIVETDSLDSAVLPGASCLGSTIGSALIADAFEFQQAASMKINKPGLYKRYTHIAVPLCLGDYYVDPDDPALRFRCVGTTPNFFTDLVLDIDTEEKFQFAEGRCFESNNAENGLFECVVGSIVARRCGIKLGDRLKATHGDPDSVNAHIHEQEYTVVGIVERTGTPNDRVVYLNMEGFFLMEDHSKPLEKDSILKNQDEIDEGPIFDPLADDIFDEDDESPTEVASDSEPSVGTEDETSEAMMPAQLTPEEEFAKGKRDQNPVAN